MSVQTGAARLLGVDGCPAGWVVAESHLADGGPVRLATPRFWIARTFGELMVPLEGANTEGADTIVAVDIPIGLAAGRPHDNGIRTADRAARAFLGGKRGSSVFAAPCRRTLDAENYVAACAAEAEARGVMLSRQAFGILPKIREVDRVIQPAHQQPPGQTAGPAVREVHPEVAFALLAGGGAPGCGLVSGKRTHEGESERLSLLRPFVGELEIGAIRAKLTAAARQTAGTRDGRIIGRVVGRDDIVDALACLVVAYRIAQGQARTFPAGPPQQDVRGLRMEIVG